MMSLGPYWLIVVEKVKKKKKNKKTKKKKKSEEIGMFSRRPTILLFGKTELSSLT